MKRLLFTVLMLWGVAYGQICADEDTVRSNTATMVTYNSARINGTTAHMSGAVTSIQLKYVRVGQTDTVTSSGSAALRNITGLQASTQYYYYYKTICGSGTKSQTIGAYTFTTLANTIIYASERPTVFHYVYADSLLQIGAVDTSLYRAPTHPSIVYKSSDDTYYGYHLDCSCWQPLAIDSSGIIALLDDKVDSVTVSGDSLFYWKVGVSYGYILPSVATVWHTTGNAGIDTSTDFIGTTDNVDFPIKTNDVRRFTVNTSGALGIGATPDYGTSGYLLQSAGDAAAPAWTAYTFQNALTAGPALSGSNTVTGGGAFKFEDPTSFTIEKSGIARLQITNGTSSLSNSTGIGKIQFTSTVSTLSGVDQTLISGGNNYIDLHNDSITIEPQTGLLFIDTLTNLSTQDELLGRKNSTGQVGYITVGSGLSLSGGELTTDNLREIPYIETNTFAALTGYTAVGSPTYSISGGKVVFTGAGTGSVSGITKYIRNDLGVLDECNTIQGTITIDAVPDANSYGVSIGFKTYTSYGSTQSLTAGIVCATGANFGKPFIYSAYSSTVYYGTANTDINNGDVIRLSLATSGWTLRLLVQNFTQGWEESLDLPNVGGFTPLTHNGSYPSFFHNGGNVSLDSFKYIINAPLATDILFLGNSITYGQSATTVAKRYVNLVGNTVNNIMSGGGSEVTADFITRLPEIVEINPQRVILHDLAGNDIANAISSATWQANLITIRNTLNAAGIQVIWTNGQPRTGLDLTAQKTFIEGEATFAGDMIIDTWAAMLGSGTNPVSAYMADATHPNDLGMAATANAINTALGYPTNIGLRVGVNTAFADIGTGSIYGNSSYGLTLRGRTGASADLTWFDVAGNAVLWIPTGTYDVLTQGKFGVGLLGGTATANLHIKAGTATASSAPLKFTTGTSLTATEAGAFEYTTPQLFFTNGGLVRQELFQGQQSRVSTQYDNTTTTLGNVTGLTANVAAGKIYRFEAKLYTTSDVAGGIKVAIGGTATATAIRYEGLTTDAGLTTQSRSAALGTAVGAVTAVTAAYVTITGTITVNAAGTLTVQAAANSATGTTSVLTGSTFVITEML